MIRSWLISFVAWAFYKLLTSTWRLSLVKCHEYEEDLKAGKPIIFAMWHGDELAAISFSNYFKLGTLTSTSKDGEIMDRVLRRLGFETSRGSSTRGGATALKGLIRLGKQRERVIVIPVDGPKGPRHKSKPGVFEISRILGARIYPIGISASKKHIFEKSWNKAILPLPFSKTCMVVASPLEPILRTEDPKSPELAYRLEEALHGAGDQAATLIDTQKPE